MSEIERAYRAHMSTSTAQIESKISLLQAEIAQLAVMPRNYLSPGPRVPTTKIVPSWEPPPSDPRLIGYPNGAPYPLFTPSGNDDVDEAAIAQDAANQRYLNAAEGSWLPFLVAAAVGIVFLVATPYWVITVLLFFGAAFWAFAWVPTVARRKRWMESRGRYYGAVKHIAELETWHEQNP